MTEYNKYFWQKAVRDSGLGFTDQGIIQALGTYSDKNGHGVRVAHETLAELGDCSAKTVSRAIKRALDAGLIELVSRAVNRGDYPRPATYRLTVPLNYWAEDQLPGTSFFPSFDRTPMSTENEQFDFDRTPMSTESRFDRTPMSTETGPNELSPDISDGFTGHLRAIDRTFKAVSPDTHVHLTEYEQALTESGEQSGPNGPGGSASRGPRVTPRPMDRPLMTSITGAASIFPQPRLAIEARLQRPLTETEEQTAAYLHAKGQGVPQILQALRA